MRVERRLQEAAGAEGQHTAQRVEAEKTAEKNKKKRGDLASAEEGGEGEGESDSSVSGRDDKSSGSGRSGRNSGGSGARDRYGLGGRVGSQRGST